MEYIGKNGAKYSQWKKRLKGKNTAKESRLKMMKNAWSNETLNNEAIEKYRKNVQS